jgi:predicted  nucleic acid-binding Zn-ribbon protein
VNQVLESLLALQRQDDVVDDVVSKVEALAPRLRALDAARDHAERQLTETRAMVEADERRHRELEGRLSDHRQRHERNLAHLDAVKRMREATAAMMQVEAGRKLLLEEESELKSLAARVADGHGAIRRQEEDLVALGQSQAEAREAIATEQAALEARLAEERGVRGGIAVGVEGGLLHKYDRIRSRRRSQAVFPLDGGACGCCDTAVPVQRRKQMVASGIITVCEACGVLLYATE